MNLLHRSFAAALILSGAMASPEAYAQSEEPIIEFHTNIYEVHGAQNAFSIRLGSTEKDYFDVDCGFGTEEVEIAPAVFDSETQSVNATVVSCVVNEQGIVKIYGDASKIDYVDFEGASIDKLDIDKCTEITILDLSHNELKALDLTPFTKLQAIYLTDNPFTAETPLKVGGNKPELMILELDIIDHLDQSFNLSDYPALVAFDGYHNMDLRNVDPTGCPELQVLSVEMAPVSTLDVSKNAKLLRLNISDSRISSIDISKNRNLQMLMAQHVSGTINTDVKLDAIDLTNNPNLTVLNLGGNNLSAIDLSKNTYITNLVLRDNKLSAIDLSANTNLYSVDLAYNNLDFASLPLPQDTWGEYYYFRSPLSCDKSYAKGADIDFSKSVLRPETTTTVRAWRRSLDADAEIIDPSEYEYSDGKIRFKSAYTDSVYVEFVNSAFVEYNLSSAPFMVKEAGEIGTPSKMVGMKLTSAMAGKQVSFKVGMDNATVSAPKTFYVDFGDGERKPFTATSIGVPSDANCTVMMPTPITGELVIYIPENESLTALEVNDVAMSAIDLSAATELRWLTVSGCNLSSIDLATNRCLQTLDISGNRLGNVDLAGVRGDYEKYVLREIDASGNRIYNFHIIGISQLEKLDLSNNLLTTFVLKDYESLTDLDLSNNRIKEELNLAYLAKAENINLSGNTISSLVLVDMPALKSFDISNNDFTLETLPYLRNVSDGVYVYAPQKDIQLAAVAPGINLSAQNRVIDGEGTVFTWKKSDGSLLVQGVDMDCNNGATKFLKTDLGKVYCEMTNPSFPEFTGDNVFKTTEVEVAEAPTNVVASFTTVADGNNGEVIFTGTKTSSLYIDWRGDGTEYIEYPINGENYMAYPQQSYYAGVEVKVYTYESAEDVKVFSIYNVPMSKIDATPLTNLTAFAVGGAGLSEDGIMFPESPALTELTLNGNALSSTEFLKGFTSLRHLTLSGNKYETFDASELESLQTLMLSNNNIGSVTLANRHLWGLDLAGNNLSDISFDKTPSLSQVVLSNNKFSSVDLSPLKANLVALDVQGNNFDFSTLPLHSDFPLMSYYRYANQNPCAVECVDGKVDLSAQAEVAGTPTVFRWFLGEVAVDPESYELVGEELETGGDDPEFTVENGVTTFHYTFNDKVTCVMTNPVFENLILYTVPVAVVSAGITEADADSVDTMVDVYSVSGVKVRSKVTRAEALEGLAPGFYIIGGDKVLVK